MILFTLDGIKAVHRGLLGVVCRFPVLAMILGALAVGYAGLILKGLETELLPPFREGHFVVQAIGAPGTSLEETMRFGSKVSEELLSLPEIATIEMQAGRSGVLKPVSFTLISSPILELMKRLFRRRFAESWNPIPIVRRKH